MCPDGIPNKPAEALAAASGQRLADPQARLGEQADEQLLLGRHLLPRR